MRYLATIAAACLLAGFAKAGPPCPADFAWASALKDQKAAAFAWASAKCPCGPDCKCDDCQCPKNLRGLEWKPAPKGDVNHGKVMYLVEPRKCGELECTKEKIVGGITIETGDYQPFDGRKWGASCKPPIAFPKLEADEAARIIAAALIGLVSDEPDCPPGIKCPQQAGAFPSATFSGGGTGVVVEGGGGPVFAVAESRPRGPLRRLITAPFRAIRAVRQARAASFEVAAPLTFTTFAAPRPIATSFTTYKAVPDATFTLQPVTKQVPVTTYQWIKSEPAEKKPVEKK